MNNNISGSDELLKKLTEQLSQNNNLVAKLLAEVSELKQQQKMFSAHLNQIYNSKSIEETLGIMSNMGKSDLNAEECDVYSYDTLENKLFTVNADGERVYTDISENTILGAALMKNEIFLENQYNGAMLGDGKDSEKTRNVAVIPIESKSGDVIGVVVAKNKDKDFTMEDVGKFDLENGNIGSAFRMGLENKALQQAAVTDKLTHLHNRQGAQAFLKNTVLRNIHEGKPVSTIMLDIDKFKSFNDTYGHDVGDMVLKQVADILKENVRSEDGVFRWGGEEMVVIANMDGTEAYSLAERLRQSIQNTPLNIGEGQQVKITASMGVAQVVTDVPERLNGENIMQYFESKPLKRADERLYEAKENGRNCVVASNAVMQRASVRSERSEDRRKSSVLNDIKDIKKTEQPKPAKDKPPKSKDNSLE
ncbi:MAG: GGDEF domain-containing protein [Eubacterium sp.]|nr:GGDEF domain-containing protein [Eubacterium sp.]